ncbi:MAG: nucleoside hydrolase [Prolixibacteraceae bacterium]|nr:nucleoside hydrolase [Prolixibacteraceae bacterium]
MKRIAILLPLLLVLLNSAAQEKIIFDTDFGGDADDLGALAMLHGFVDSGECDLLAVMLWTNEKYAVPAVDAVNRYYGHPDIPIGVRAGGTHINKNAHTKVLADNFHYEQTYSDVPSTTKLYRKILAESDDSSIVLVTVGPLLNIQLLLKSEPCEYSSLTGKELLHQKVKEMVVMGGQYPKGDWEWNFNGDMPGVTKYVFDHIELPVVFSGYELGLKIKTGSVFNQIPNDHPLYVGYHHFSKHAPWMKENYDGKILDNASYDQTAVLYAVKGGVGEWWTKVEEGCNKIGEEGDNKWVHVGCENKRHAYLKLKEEPEKIAETIEALMMYDLK